jgi:hypothetical protein
VTMELLNRMRLSSQRMWERAVEVLGKEGSVGVGTFCGVLFSCGGIFEWV